MEETQPENLDYHPPNYLVAHWCLVWSIFMQEPAFNNIYGN